MNALVIGAGDHQDLYEFGEDEQELSIEQL
jgi:hypothetical protein